MKFITFILTAIFLPTFAFANSEPKTVRWVGQVYDLPTSHTTEHAHSLLFEEAESQKTYDIVKSPELERIHHETNKNFKVEVEGYLTPKFLFWGGNLVVSKYNILSEGEEVQLSEPVRRERTSSMRDRN